MTNNVNATVNTVNASDEAVNVRSAVSPMRKAICNAHLLGNPHAITLVEAVANDAAPTDYAAWESYCRDLRTCAIEYGKLAEKKDSNADDLANAKSRVFQSWRSILKVGEENLFHKNMFIREADADTIRVYAVGITTHYIEGIGTIPAVTSEKNFRRMVELFLGCRIAANEALCDADRDVISKYKSFTRTMETGNKRLNGDGDGENRKPGLLENLATLQAKEAGSIEFLADLGITEEAEISKMPAMVALRNKIREVEKAILDTQKSIKDAEENRDAVKTRYEEIIATLNKIEAVATR